MSTCHPYTIDEALTRLFNRLDAAVAEVGVEAKPLSSPPSRPLVAAREALGEGTNLPGDLVYLSWSVLRSTQALPSVIQGLTPESETYLYTRSGRALSILLDDLGVTDLDYSNAPVSALPPLLCIWMEGNKWPQCRRLAAHILAEMDIIEDPLSTAKFWFALGVASTGMGLYEDAIEQWEECMNYGGACDPIAGPFGSTVLALHHAGAGLSENALTAIVLRLAQLHAHSLQRVECLFEHPAFAQAKTLPWFPALKSALCADFMPGEEVVKERLPIVLLNVFKEAK